MYVCRSQLMHVRFPMHDDKYSDSAEREFIFSLADKLGIASLQVFAGNWQDYLTCQQLQQLIMRVAPADDVDHAPRTPDLTKIIQTFYSSRLCHDEDSCQLLTKYVKPSDKLYGKIVTTILKNAGNYHSEALFQLAQLQAANRQACGEVMNADIFSIVTKAFEKLSQVSSSAKMLDYVDWLFTMCTGRNACHQPFFADMINLVCSPDTHQQILLRVLQRMESHELLKKHPSVAGLGLALISKYGQHFVKRFGECGHMAYALVIAEMQRARLECRHFVENGEATFDAQVVECVRSSHGTKKKLIKLLSADFPERPKPESS